MDHPQEKPSTTGGLTVAVPVVHAAAADLAAVLEQHYRPHEARRTKGEAEPPAPDAPRITADERTNQILVTGTEVEIDRLKAAIRLLDTPVRPQGVEAHVVPLQHVEAQGAASALGSLISMSPRLWADPAATPSVVAHPDGKALLVAAGGTDFETLRALIAELDTGR
jgi:general secretion pathway protein D